MSNAWYDKVLTRIGQGSLNLNSLTSPKIIAVENGLYTFNQSHEFLSDIPAGARLATTSLTGDSFGTPEGWLDANDVVFTIPTIAPPTDYKARWTMDNAQVSGSALLDISGNSHTATMVNTPTTGRTGKVNESVLFESANSEYATVTDHADFKPTSNLSVCGWVKSLSTIRQLLFQSSSGHATDSAGFKVHLFSTGAIALTVADGSGSVEDTDFKTLTSVDLTNANGSWHHFGATYDGATMKVYVDGTLNATAAFAITIGYGSPNYVQMAARNLTGTPDDYLNGELDDLYYFNRTITAAEMKAIASVPAPTVEELIIYDDLGSESTSPLLLFIDNANILPITPEAGKDLQVDWQGSGIARL